MTDSSRYVPSDPSPKINEYIQNNLKGFSFNARPIPRQSLANRTVTEMQDTGIHSIQLIESMDDLEEKVKGLSYLEIQLSNKPELLMVQKFMNEFEDRYLTSEQLENNDKTFKISYSKQRKLQCEIKLHRSRIIILTKYKAQPVDYEDVKGIIIGGMSSTIKKLFKRSGPFHNEYFFSLILSYRTYDFTMFNYQKYLLIVRTINENLQKSTQICEIKRMHLTFYLVKCKIIEEARKRNLTVSQWFLLGFITYAREIADTHREQLLLNILKKSLGNFNRLFALITYLKNIQKSSLAAMSNHKERKDWNRIAEVNAKRYFKLKEKLGRNVDDTALENVLQIQKKQKRKFTFKHFSPNLLRLFRK